MRGVRYCFSSFGQCRRTATIGAAAAQLPKMVFQGVSQVTHRVAQSSGLRVIAVKAGASTGAAGLAVVVLCGTHPRSMGAARAEEAEPEKLEAAEVARSPPTAQCGSCIYVWGQRSSFPVSEDLGDTPPDADVRVPTEVTWFRRHAEQHQCRWRQLAFGPSFGVACTDAGELFAWGSCRSRDGQRRFAGPRPLLLDGGSASAGFRDVQCSESAVWALSAAGEVVVWERIPGRIAEHLSASPDPGARGCLGGGRRLSGLERPVVQMAVGASHAAFITDDGELYCLGSNKYGECCVDPAVHSVVPTCRRVKMPRHSNPVAHVQCGRAHTVALGAEGDVFAWGDDSKIQLGLGDTRSNIGDERPGSGSRGYHRYIQSGEGMVPPSALRGQPDAPPAGRKPGASAARYGEFEPHCQWRPLPMMPIPLEFERQAHGIPYPPPDRFQCGDDFTVLVARDSPDWFAPEEESNRLFCCGENGQGQCGRSLQSSQQTLAAARVPRNSLTLGLSCGSAHCLAVLRRVGAQKRELWAWGSNERGQAGTGGVGTVCPAARLRLPKHSRVQAVWSGFASSAAICSDKVPGAQKRPGPASCDDGRRPPALLSVS